MILRRPLVGAASVLAALTLTACASGAAAPAASADDGVVVVASTNVYGSIAEAVGGPGVVVESLVDDPAADPHSYESTPADAVVVGRGDIVILNGGGYDEFMPQLVEAAGGERTVLDVGALSGLAPAGQEEDGEVNEHFWYSLPAVRTLAAELATALGELDPAGAAGYTANAEAFTAQVDELVVRVEAAGASVPGGRVAVTEPVPGYLVETAGLTDATPPEFSEAVEEDTDPPAAVVAETLALFTPGAPDAVRALIVNAQTETPTTDQVRSAAQAAGVPVVEMTETLPEGQPDYLSWMGAQVDALTAALNPV